MSNISDPRFANVEAQYAALKAQLAAGQLTREQFEAALQKQMILDAQGRYWMMGAESGHWYLFDGQNWVQQDPPSAAAKPPPAPDVRAAQRVDAVTLASFMPPQIPKTEPPLAFDQRATMVGFTPPQIPSQPGAPPVGVPPQPPAATAAGTGPRVPMALVMGGLFLLVCVVGLIALVVAVNARFGAPSEVPASTATLASGSPTAIAPTATAMPSATTVTGAIATATRVIQPTALPTRQIQLTVPIVLPATATPTLPSTDTPTTVPSPTPSNTPLPPTATRTRVPEFNVSFAFQGYERWGQPDPNDCTIFNNKIPVRQFKWDMFVTNRSATNLAPSEWQVTAFNEQGGAARVCISNLPNIPAGLTGKTTFVAYVNQDQYVGRVVHQIRNTTIQRCLDAAWKEISC